MSKKLLVLFALAATAFTACAPSSPVALVDVQRITQNWSTYQGYQAQFMMQEQQIAQSHVSDAQKASEVQRLQQQVSRYNTQLFDDVQNAAEKVATQRGFHLVLTRQGVGYGGIDITPDVEKLLNITEQATPAPSPSPAST